MDVGRGLLDGEPGDGAFSPGAYVAGEIPMDPDSVMKVCLFTDLVGSTDLKQRLGDSKAATSQPTSLATTTATTEGKVEP